MLVCPGVTPSFTFPEQTLPQFNLEMTKARQTVRNSSANRQLDSELELAHEHGFGDGEAYNTGVHEKTASGYNTCSYLRSRKRSSFGLGNNTVLVSNFGEGTLECPVKRMHLGNCYFRAKLF